MRDHHVVGRIAVAAVAVCAALGALVPGAAAASEDDGVPTKVVKMDVENWRWIPDEIRVVRGTKVVLKIHSYDATHRFDLKAYRLKVLLPQDKTTTFHFLADKVGEFKWKCGRPCGDGCPRMTGKLIVTEPANEESSETGAPD